jgi:hypothetical protein
MAAIFGLVAAVYLSLVGRFVLYSSPPTGDQPTYMMVTMSIVQDGDLNLKNNFAQRDEDRFYRLAPHPPDFVGMSAPYPLPPHGDLATARPDDTELYNPHFPGLSVLIIPAWIVGGWFQLWWPISVGFICLLGALVVLNVFLLAYELTGRLWIAWVVALSLAFMSPIMTYSYMIFSELPTALLTIYAFRRLALGWGANGPWRRALIGLCIGYIPWLAWRNLIVAVPLGIYAAVQWARYYGLLRMPKGWPRKDQKVRRAPITTPLLEIDGERRGGRLGAGVRSALPYLAPLVLSAILMLWYNYFHYGKAIPAATVPELGPNVSPFRWPWAGIEELTHFVYNMFAHLFDRPMGLITNGPVYVLSFVGMVALFRSRQPSDRRLLLAILFIALPLFALVSAFIYWNGLWNPPARYLTIVAPLMSAPLAMSLYAIGGGLGWIYRGMYALLAIPGFLMMAIRMHDARFFWPADPISGWLYQSQASPFQGNIEFARGFENLFPAFSPVDEVRLPGNTAWMAGASLLIVLVSYLFMSRPRKGYQPVARKLPAAAHAAGWLCAIGLVMGGWLLINREYIKHKTILTENTRWGLNPALVQGEGIAYSGNNIYAADYRGKLVGRLDMNRGEYYPLQLSGVEGAAYGNPGELEAGPDGLLYLLNNGDGENALYIMEQDGRIVGRGGMEGKSPVAVGMSFGPDGNLYVSDMLGGQILKYGNRGGGLLGSTRPLTGGFNNVKGITVGSDGSIYAAEIGNERIYRFNGDLTFNRVYEMGCKPLFMALSSEREWMEVSCETKLVSLNIETGLVQNVHVENAAQLQHPNGITYGPDGTLYVLENNGVVIAYTVKH